jgi:hypothetical protein
VEDFNMAKLWSLMRRRKESKLGNRFYLGKRFYTSRDMSEIKHFEAVMTGKRKRGEASNHPNQYIVICGCGFEGCFVHGTSETQSKEDKEYWQRHKEQNKLLEKERHQKMLQKKYIRKSKKKLKPGGRERALA